MNWGFFEKNIVVNVLRHKHARRLLLGCAAGLMLLFILALKNFLLLGLLFVMNVLVSIAMRPLKKFTVGLAVEMVTFSSVIAGIVYGPTIGAAFATLALLTNFFFLGRITMFFLLVLPIYAGIGLLSSSFSPANVSAVGIWLSILYNIIVSLFIIILFGGSIKKCVAFSSINILFNVLLFTHFAGPIIHVMA